MMEKGDEVVATHDIGGGMFQDYVPKGTRGVVTEARWNGDLTVMFEVEGFLNNSRFEITVDEDDVR